MPTNPKQHLILKSDATLILITALGCAVLAFAVTRFGFQEGSASAIRLSSAWLLGILILRQPSLSRTCVLLLIGWAALTVGVYLTGHYSATMSLGLGGARAFEAAVAFAMLRLFSCNPVGLKSLGDLGCLAIVVLFAPAIAGVLRSSQFLSVQGQSAVSMWQSWWIAGVFGMLTLLPIMLSATPERLRTFANSRLLGELAFFGLLTIGISVTSVIYLDQPFILLTLPLLLAAFRMGVFGTATLSLLTVSTLLILHRYLPPDQQQGIASLSFGEMAFYSAMSLVPPLAVSTLQEQRQLISRALEDSFNQLRLISDNVPALIGRRDREGHYLFVNRAYSQLLGHTPDELIGKTLGEVIGQEYAADNLERVAQVLAGNITHFETRVAGRDLDVTYVPHVTGNEVLDFFVLGHDVTARKQAEAALFEEKERAQVTLNSIGDAVVACDAEMRVTYLNPIAEDMTGWRNQEAIGRQVDEIVQLIDLASEHAPLSPLFIAVRDNRVVALQTDTALKRRDGMSSPIEDSAAPIHDRDGRVVGGVMVFHDVSESRAMALKMSHQAQHDYLTDLPNRVLLQDRLTQSLAMIDKGSRGALLFIDLDHFKTINDSLGHPVGDLVLQEVARRLLRTVRPDDTVSRQGGDEFVVLLVRLHDPRDAARVAEKMISAMKVPIEVDGQQLYVGLSIGISLFPQDAADVHSLTKNADTALYHAKKSGRGTYSYFSASMSEKAEQRMLLEQDLRRALQNDELFLVYQPKVMRPEGRITGMEALVRWRRSDGRVVPPLEFIPVAEESGLIGAIDTWVMREACRQNRAWQDAGAAQLPISVNVSLARIDADQLLLKVSEVLQQSGLSAEYLEIEFTESQMFADKEQASHLIEGLHSLRVRIAIDDFGTGYSNLGYLAQYHFNTLKIDRSFIRNIPHDIKQDAVVEAITAMARALDADVVAEGVETEKQAQALESHGCYQVQGYLYSRPVSAAEFFKLLEQSTIHAALSTPAA